MPFLKSQSLKSLGVGIDTLCERLAETEISQISFISKDVFIDEVRLPKSYGQVEQPDSLMMQSFTQQ